MLKDNYDILLTAFDHLVFEKLVPADHFQFAPASIIRRALRRKGGKTP